MDIFSIIKTNLLLSRICGLSRSVIVSDCFQKSKRLQNYSRFMLCLNALIQLAYVIETAFFTPVKEIYALLGSLDLIGFAVSSILTSFLLIYNEDKLNSAIIHINRIYFSFLMLDNERLKNLHKTNIFIAIFSIFVAIIISFYEVVMFAVVHGGSDYYLSTKFFSMFFRSNSFAIFFMQFTTYIFIISTSYKAVNTMFSFLKELSRNYKRKQLRLLNFNEVQFLKKIRDFDDLLKDFHKELNQTFSFYCAAISSCLFFELLYSSISYVKNDNRSAFDHASNVLWVSFFGIQFISCVWACDFATYKVRFYILND